VIVFTYAIQNFIHECMGEYKYKRIIKFKRATIHLYKCWRKDVAKADRTTVSIPMAKKMELERKAIEISYKTGKSIKWTDIIHYMIENYQVMAKQDLIEDETKKI